MRLFLVLGLRCLHFALWLQTVNYFVRVQSAQRGSTLKSVCVSSGASALENARTRSLGCDKREILKFAAAIEVAPPRFAAALHERKQVNLGVRRCILKWQSLQKL